MTYLSTTYIARTKQDSSYFCTLWYVPVGFYVKEKKKKKKRKETL